MSKEKGSRAERELLHMFWERAWYCTRMAGSGSMPFPCPDLLAGKKGRVLAIECKSGKKTRYVDKKQINELLEFSNGFGAEPWIAARFNNMEWRFLRPEQLKSSGKNFSIPKEALDNEGIGFDALLKKMKKGIGKSF